jgi:hypothetical protein
VDGSVGVAGAQAPEEVPDVPSFETFTRRLVPLAREPMVTIHKRGTISLNKSAHAELGSPAAVELLFDRDEMIVGLRCVDPSVDHAYPVRSASGRDNGPYIISAIAFTKFHAIKPEVSLRWPSHMDGDVLCVPIKAEGIRVTSNRAIHQE